MPVSPANQQRVVFRTDSSVQIGAGHIMRCLTLARELDQRGYQCSFVSRDHPGALHEAVTNASFELHKLESDTGDTTPPDSMTEFSQYTAWVGAAEEDDARQTIFAFGNKPVSWLVVDHYGLHAAWESLVKPACKFVMAIDDLARPRHVCDLILDQNLGRSAEEYRDSDSEKLIGPRFALLRESFAELRDHSLARRASPRLAEVLVTMGAMDVGNVSGRVLNALNSKELVGDFVLTVILDRAAPHLKAIEAQAQDMRLKTRVLTSVSNMAELMANCDLAIGAAGTTSWERCCLGLPSIVVRTAENQRAIAAALTDSGVAVVVKMPNLEKDIVAWVSHFRSNPSSLTELALRSSKLVDGAGTRRVADAMQIKGA